MWPFFYYWINLFTHTRKMPKEEKEKIICSKDNVFLNLIKEKTVYQGGYSGWRVRLFKGVSVNTWWWKGSYEKEKYVDKIWPWELRITDKRIIFMSIEKNVVIKAQDAIKANAYTDWIELADEKGTYLFTFEDDGWEFCNQFIKYIDPNAKLLEPKPKEEEKKKSFKDMHLKDLKRYHRLLLFFLIIFISVICS